MFNKQLLRRLYLAALCAAGLFLPLSVWLLSVSMLILLLVWLADGGILRLAGLRNNGAAILIFLGIYLVHFLWMVNSADLNYGFRELRLMLPLLLFPLAIGLSDPVTKNDLKVVLSFFIAGVVVSSGAGLIWFKFSNPPAPAQDPREISVFISNVRLSLMTDLAIIFSAWFFFSSSDNKFKWLYLISGLWLVIFLFFLLSLTGILLFSLILFVTVIYFTVKIRSALLKAGLSFLLLISVLIPVFFISGEVKQFYKKGDAYNFPLEERTRNGNPYKHFTDRKDTENGNLVWIYINEDEMRKGWNAVSSMNYDSKDSKGQDIRYTIIRYLTSAGLKKDSSGIASLRKEDINLIESGVANKSYSQAGPLRVKIREIIWQIDYYRNGGNPSGHSVTQRIQYFKTGWNLFRKNLLFGTGTGDLKEEMLSQYEEDKTMLGQDYRYLPHNQYLTFLISFGLTGFVLICCSILIPVIITRAYRNILFNLFFMIVMISMFGEDTLETHTGVSFFGYFYALFVFGTVKSDQYQIYEG